MLDNSAGPRTGRPRDSRVDAALLEAAAQLIVERGYGALTLQAVADAAGTSRPALYRRYSSRADLVVSVLIDRYGLHPGAEDLGGVEAELLAIQQHQRDLFNDPVLRRAVPGLLEELGRTPEVARRFQEQFLRPRRSSTATILERAAARGEIEPGVDSEWVCDLITGPMLMRALLPELGPIDEEFVRRTVQSALDAVGRHRH